MSKSTNRPEADKYVELFLNNLTTELNKHKMSDRSLSDTLGRGNNYISRLRNYKIRLTVKAAGEIADALNVPLLEFFKKDRNLPIEVSINNKLSGYSESQLNAFYQICLSLEEFSAQKTDSDKTRHK